MLRSQLPQCLSVFLKSTQTIPFSTEVGPNLICPPIFACHCDLNTLLTYSCRCVTLRRCGLSQGFQSVCNSHVCFVDSNRGWTVEWITETQSCSVKSYSAIQMHSDRIAPVLEVTQDSIKMFTSVNMTHMIQAGYPQEQKVSRTLLIWNVFKNKGSVFVCVPFVFFSLCHFFGLIYFDVKASINKIIYRLFIVYFLSVSHY